MLMKSDTSDELSIKWKIEFWSQCCNIITSDIMENIETIICNYVNEKTLKKGRSIKLIIYNSNEFYFLTIRWKINKLFHVN